MISSGDFLSISAHECVGQFYWKIVQIQGQKWNFASLDPKYEFSEDKSGNKMKVKLLKALFYDLSK